MKNELEQMDLFINVQITPAKLQSNTEVSLQQHISYAEKEKLRVCNVILTEVFELNLCQKAEAYIQLHQAALSHLVDTLQHYTSETKGELKSFYSQISDILDAIARYIQEYHNKFIDHDLPIPLSYSKLLQDNLGKAIKDIEKWYKTKKLDSTLLDIAIRPVRTLIKSPYKISFRKAEYLQELTKDLLELKMSSTEDDINKRFHEILHIINFNSPEYIYYCTTALDRKLGEEDNQQKKLELLQWYIKIINQQPLKEGFALFPNLPPVCKTMLIWINEEYQYLATQRSDLNESNSAISLPLKKGNGVKINTSLPVPQLAVLVKLFIKSGIITNEKKIEVIRIVAENFSSIRADEISDESLRSKYHNIEPGAVEAIKERLKDFPAILDKLLID